MKILIVLLILFAILNISCLSIKLYKLEIMNYFKNKIIKFLAAFLPFIIIFVLSIFHIGFDIVNTIIILLYFAVIWNIMTFINWLINKFLKKKISKNIVCAAATMLTLLYLGHGYYLAHNIEGTHYKIYTEKNIGTKKFRIIQISDSHIGNTMSGAEFANYMDKINQENPDIIVVTGDFIDDDTNYEDMVNACIGLGKLKTKYGAYFVYGNHDKGYFTYRGYDDSKLREELKKNNIIILEDDVVQITDDIYLIGRQDKSEKNRKTIFELMEKVDKNKYAIDLNHQPNDYENEEKAQVDLVLSGHTHGGQFFPLGQLGVVLGLNDSYYGLETRNKTTFIVNSGIGGWNLKFKTGTISEYNIIDIEKN